jgi:hypothetical protein
LTGNQLDISTGLMQYRRKVNRRSAAADDHHVPTREPFGFGMTKAMRQQFRGQMCQVLRDVFEVSDPDRDHYPPCRDRFAAIEPEKKSLRRAFETDNQLVLKFR